LIPDGVNVIFY